MPLKALNTFEWFLFRVCFASYFVGIKFCGIMMFKVTIKYLICGLRLYGDHFIRMIIVFIMS